VKNDKKKQEKSGQNVNKNAFLRVDLNLFNDPRISKMRYKLNTKFGENTGTGGFGTLIMLLYKIEKRGGKLPLNIPRLSRLLRVPEYLLNSILYDFDFFRIEDNYIYPVIDICGYNDRGKDSKKLFGNPYIRLNYIIMDDENILDMICELNIGAGLGMAGFGAYIMILSRLYYNNNMLEFDVELLSFELNLSADLLEKLLTNFNLFGFLDGGLFYSFCLDVFCEKSTAKSFKRSIAGYYGGLKSSRKGVKNKKDAESKQK
jgi:hypothetical protein